MTIRVEPTHGPGREVYPVRLQTAVKYAAGDWIVDGSTDLQASRDPELLAGPYNAAWSNDSTTSLTVTIDTFEALLEGAYIASDDSTVTDANGNAIHDVTLDASTNNQEVFLGYDHTATDTIIIGKAGAFPSAENPRIKIWEYDTDSSGVTRSTSHRPIGQRHSNHNSLYDSNLNGTVDDAVTAQALGGRSPSVVFRDVVSRGVPVTTLQNGDAAKQGEVIPEGKDMKILHIGAAEHPGGTGSSGLYARIYDPKAGANLWDMHNDRRLEGTVDNPVTSIPSDPGGRFVDLQCANETGAEVDAEARFRYILE